MHHPAVGKLATLNLRQNLRLKKPCPCAVDGVELAATVVAHHLADSIAHNTRFNKHAYGNRHIASGNQRVNLGGSVVENAVHTHQQACRLGAIILLRHIHLHRALSARINAALLMLETLYRALRRHLRLHCKRHQACYECY